MTLVMMTGHWLV